MSHKLGVVVTTIQPPTDAVKALAERLDTGPENRLFIIGDVKGPREWDGMLPCEEEFWDLETQSALPWKLANALETDSYARKNLGYLLAMQWGAECIYETDDDNQPQNNWRRPTRKIDARLISHDSEKWVNPYTPFVTPHSAPRIWPRGFPLDEVNSTLRLKLVNVQEYDCPVQNGLVNVSPDVDAIWRMLNRGITYSFVNEASIAVEFGFWAPFNSQNTWWFPEAYEFMYLPTWCSIRMLDIWRGYIAQRCLWQMRKHLGFHAADMLQIRNEHDLIKDFAAEMDGYTHAKKFCEVLRSIKFLQRKGGKPVGEMLRACYEELIKAGFFDPEELDLVDLWLGAVKDIRSANA